MRGNKCVIGSSLSESLIIVTSSKSAFPDSVHLALNCLI